MERVEEECGADLRLTVESGQKVVQATLFAEMGKAGLVCADGRVIAMPDKNLDRQRFSLARLEEAIFFPGSIKVDEAFEHGCSGFL